MEKTEQNAGKETFFDIIYTAAEGVIKNMKKPMVIRALKRKFQSALDSAQTKIDEAEAKKQKSYENITDVNINDLMEHCADIRQAQNVITDLKAEYKKLFGEELHVAE